MSDFITHTVELHLTEDEQGYADLQEQKQRVLSQRRKETKKQVAKSSSASVSVSTEQRIKDIDRELYYLKVKYEKDLDTPVVWDVNNLTYKPKWAEEEYIDLISAYTMLGTTYMPIEDSTHLPSRTMVMTANQLTSLFNFLTAKVYDIRIIYCTERSSLLMERKRLLAQ